MRGGGNFTTGCKYLAKSIAALMLIGCFILASMVADTVYYTEVAHAISHKQNASHYHSIGQDAQNASDDCDTCSRIQFIGNLLSQFHISAKTMPIALANALHATAVLHCDDYVSDAQTPVSLKNRMDN